MQLTERDESRADLTSAQTRVWLLISEMATVERERFKGRREMRRRRDRREAFMGGM